MTNYAGRQNQLEIVFAYSLKLWENIHRKSPYPVTRHKRLLVLSFVINTSLPHTVQLVIKFTRTHATTNTPAKSYSVSDNELPS